MQTTCQSNRLRNCRLTFNPVGRNMSEYGVRVWLRVGEGYEVIVCPVHTRMHVHVWHVCCHGHSCVTRDKVPDTLACMWRCM
jgi:hypothetical protein